MANVNYIPYPKLKATDYNGNALVGGTVTTYLNGTTTPAPTYTDYTGTTLNANPFTLPANGEMSIWLVNGTVYTIVVKDAMGNTIDTINGISASAGFVISGNVQIFDYALTDDNNSPYIKFTTTPAAVNYLTITDAATGGGPTIGTGGTDTNIDLNLLTSGDGAVILGGTGSEGVVLNGTKALLAPDESQLLTFIPAASSTNHITMNTTTGTNPVVISVAGTPNTPLQLTGSLANDKFGPSQINTSSIINMLDDGTNASTVRIPATSTVGLSIQDTTAVGPITLKPGNITNILTTASSGTLIENQAGPIFLQGFSSSVNISNSNLNEFGGNSVASASTIDLSQYTTGNYVIVTGTTSITSLGASSLAAGAKRVLQFAGILILTYNATSLILPGAANITTAVGDIAEFICLGSGHWKCLMYTRASGHALIESSAGSIPGVSGDMIYNQAGAYGADTATTDGAGNLTMTSVSPGNMNLSANTLASTNTNGAINLSPNGTGHIVANAPMDWTQGTNIASTSTTNIGAATGNSITITGTTTITAFDTIQAGARRVLTFSGILILTHNATSLILPTNANITTAAGDVAEFLSLGSGNWKCIDYQRSSGAALSGTVTIPGTSTHILYNNSGAIGADAVSTTDGSGNLTVSSITAGNLIVTGNTLSSGSNSITLAPASNNPVIIPSGTSIYLSQGSDLASASSIALGVSAGNYFNITGTTTITAFDTVQAGTSKSVKFAGILTLTYNATSLILPTSANITTAAGDTAEFVSLGSGNWKCLWYQRASGAALVGNSSAPGSSSDLLYNNAGNVAADTATTDGSGNLTATSLALSGNMHSSGSLTGTTLTLSSGLIEAATTLASSNTPALGATAGNYVSITGTTTITGFDIVQAGTRKIVTFAGVLQLTHNATSLILPSGANIITAAGDSAMFISLGSGNWRCVDYMKASGQALVSGGGAAPGSSTQIIFNNAGSLTGTSSLITDTSGNMQANSVTITGGMLTEKQGSNVASASISSAVFNGNYFNITGTSTITGFPLATAGTRVVVTFTGVLQLTHNATTFILPSAANITTAINDCATFISIAPGGTSEWQCVDYSRSSGAALVGAATAPGSSSDILYNASGLIGADTATTDGGGNLTTTSLTTTGNVTIGGTLKEFKGTNLASASTVNLGAAAGNYFNITGTTTITAFDTVSAGIRKIVRFASALTLTYNATSLILPTAANITTATDDIAIFISEGSGNWRCIEYNRATGKPVNTAITVPGSNTDLLYNSSGAVGADTATTDGAGNLTVTSLTSGAIIGTTSVLSNHLNEAKGTDLASASTVNIGAATGNYVNITGTTAITAFDTVQAGTRRILKFAGILTLTYNATSLILPTSANITTAAGDVATFISEGSGNWRCIEYTKANGHALAESSGSAPGSNSDLIYNSSGSFAADIATTDGAGNLTISSLASSGQITANGVSIGSGAARQISTTSSGLTVTTFAGNLALNPSSGSVTLAPSTGIVSLSSAALNEVESSIASATTTNIGAAAANYLTVSGTTTITAFDTVQAGTRRVLRFTNSLVLTSSGSLVLPGSVNITTVAGDVATFISEGGGSWTCVSYMRGDGTALKVKVPGSTGTLIYTSSGLVAAADTATTDGAGNLTVSSITSGAIVGTTAVLSSKLNEAKGTDIASATTTNIGAATGNFVKVTGTTTITAFDTVQAGTRRIVHFTGALILTHNGTSLILPGAANITTIAGDIATFVSLGTGNWECTAYQRTTQAPGNYITSLITGAVNTGTITSSTADSIPTTSNGNLFMTLAVQARNTANTLKIDICTVVANSSVGGNVMVMTAFLGSTAIGTVVDTIGIQNAATTMNMHLTVPAGTVSSQNITVYVGGTGAGTTTFNGANGARQMGGNMCSSIVCTEIPA